MVQAPRPGRADAPDGHAHRGRDVLVARWWNGGQSTQQHLATLRNLAERQPEQPVALLGEHNRFRSGLAGLEVEIGVDANDFAPTATQYSQALVARRGRQPSAEVVWVTHLVEMLDEAQPCCLTDICSVRGRQGKPARDRPHKSCVSLNECVPRRAVACCRRGQQLGGAAFGHEVTLPEVRAWPNRFGPSEVTTISPRLMIDSHRHRPRRRDPASRGERWRRADPRSLSWLKRRADQRGRRSRQRPAGRRTTCRSNTRTR